MIWFVGAGTYNVEMITVGAVKILKKADCILYDHLINKELLEYAKKDAELISVGKIGHESSFKQEDINELLIQKTNIYENVVRLKGGDPYLYGRGSEEMQYCLDRGYEAIYIPGISSAIGGLGYGGIPVTHRAISRGLSINTLHYQNDEQFNYDLVMNNPNTQIFFMGASKIYELVDNCLDRGMNPSTTITLASSLTYPNQKILVSNLKDIKNQDISEYTSPLLIVLGETGKFANKLNNVLRYKCYGKKLLLLSVGEDSWPVEMLNLKTGIFTYEKKIAEIIYRHDPQINLDGYDELAFVSKNAVMGFIKYLKDYHIDIRSLQNKRILSVGYKTQHCLEDMGLIVDLTLSFASALAKEVKGKTLWINGNRKLAPGDTLSVYEYRKRDFELDDKYDVIAASCPLAVEAIYNKGIDLNIPIFTFGHKSYMKAQQLNFKNIYPTDNGKELMIKRIIEFLYEEN